MPDYKSALQERLRFRFPSLSLSLSLSLSKNLQRSGIKIFSDNGGRKY